MMKVTKRTIPEIIAWMNEMLIVPIGLVRRLC